MPVLFLIMAESGSTKAYFLVLIGFCSLDRCDPDQISFALCQPTGNSFIACPSHPSSHLGFTNLEEKKAL